MDTLLLDPSHPNSLINKLDSGLREAFLSTDPRFHQMTEKGLKSAVKPDETLARVRLSLWDEYARAVEGNRSVMISRVCAGACTKQFFYDVILKDERMLAYISRPPIDHMLAMRELLDLGLQRLRAMINAPFYSEIEILDKETGQVIERRRKADASVMGQVNRAVTVLLDRVHGSVIQKQVNLNVDQPMTATPETLEELEAMEATLVAPPPVIYAVEAKDGP